MLLAFIACALLLLPVLAYLLWKHPVAFAATSVGAASYADLLGIWKEGFHLGATLYPTDLACAALLMSCTVVGLRFRSVPSDLCWPALILLFLSFLNFGRGVLLFGIRAPGNGARDLVNLILPAVAASALSPAIRMTIERLATCLSWASAGLAALAVAKWAGIIGMEASTGDDFREVPRALTSDVAIIIGQTLIAVTGVQLARGLRSTGLIFAAMLAGLVFALQHRSVWIATAAGLAWLVFRSPRLPRNQWLKLSALALFLGASLTVVPLLAPSVFDRAQRIVRSNIEEVRQEDSTWAWRVQGYSEAVERAMSESITATVIGPPSGRDLSDKANFASIHIHDRYIAVLAYYGIVGLLLLLIWLLAIAGRIRHMVPVAQHDHSSRMARVTLEALLISAVLFFVPYSGGQLEGLLLGLIWLAAAPEPRTELAPNRMVGDRSLLQFSETTAA